MAQDEERMALEYIADIIDLRLRKMGETVRDPQSGYLNNWNERPCRFGSFDIVGDKVIRIDVRVSIEPKEVFDIE